MGIYIPNMEMPKTCVQCDLKFYDPEMRWDENGIKQIGAWVCKRTREIIWNTQRGENCPLVPLPEGHGRLGDLDALEVKFREEALEHTLIGDLNRMTLGVGEVIDRIRMADTIVPAD